MGRRAEQGSGARKVDADGRTADTSPSGATSGHGCIETPNMIEDSLTLFAL